MRLAARMLERAAQDQEEKRAVTIRLMDTNSATAAVAAAAQNPSETPADGNEERNDGTVDPDTETAAAAQNPSKTPPMTIRRRKAL